DFIEQEVSEAFASAVEGLADACGRERLGGRSAQLFGELLRGPFWMIGAAAEGREIGLAALLVLALEGLPGPGQKVVAPTCQELAVGIGRCRWVDLQIGVLGGERL